MPKKHAKVRKIIVISYLRYAYLTFRTFFLALTHLVLGVLLIDHEQTTLATYDLAVGCTLF